MGINTRKQFLVLVVALGAMCFPGVASAELLFKSPQLIGVDNFAYGVAVADLDGDGNRDLVATNYGAGSITVIHGSDEGYAGSDDYTVGPNPSSVAVGDVNRDGALDLAVSNQTSDSVSILLGTGSGTFGQATDYPAGDAPRDLVLRKLDGNDTLDLAVANGTAPGSVSAMLGAPFGNFGAVLGYPVDDFSRSIAAADFNNDGILDLVTANGGGNDVSVLLGTGIGTFGAAADFATGSAPNDVAAGDLNGDGRPDLAVANTGAPTISVLLANGPGTFGPKIDYAIGFNPLSIAIGDLTNDGLPDLAVGAVSTGGTVLPGVGGGNFGAGISQPLNTTYNLVATDLNRDGVDDIVAAAGTTNVVSVLINAPDPQAGPNALEFGGSGSVPLGLVSAPQTLVIDNDGVAPMTVEGFAFGGSDPQDFFIGSDTCRRVLLDGEQCVARVFFSPKASGARTASLAVRTNGESDPVVALSGTGGALPQGPTGPSGPSGPSGPTGPAGKYANINKVTVSGPSSSRKGKTATYTLKVTNNGNAKATGVGASASGKGVSASKGLGAIEAGKTGTIKLKVKFKKTGKFKISFKVTSDNAGGKTVKKTVNVKK